VSKKASGLGRGLEALLPRGGGGVVRLPLSAIRPNPGQPRRRFSQESLEELAHSPLSLELSRHLGLPVKVLGGRRGRVVIHYRSLEELEALLERLGYQA